jgi:hypothetical protein
MLSTRVVNTLPTSRCLRSRTRHIGNVLSCKEIALDMQCFDVEIAGSVWCMYPTWQRDQKADVMHLRHQSAPLMSRERP